ncbi:hypothetical protein ADUPG1_010957 [Aduncisulcus paluster]|uniref:Uncharacterized protein n=1 Tax=Aduncisulcus paluster TaxID=2918883 RepID=A0ABQ5JYL5_9EUKA|nr:hypothetical protein ADUPG1_010957 [Aduncisulcus paluster]
MRVSHSFTANGSSPSTASVGKDSAAFKDLPHFSEFIQRFNLILCSFKRIHILTHVLGLGIDVFYGFVQNSVHPIQDAPHSVSQVSSKFYTSDIQGYTKVFHGGFSHQYWAIARE